MPAPTVLTVLAGFHETECSLSRAPQSGLGFGFGIMDSGSGLGNLGLIHNRITGAEQKKLPQTPRHTSITHLFLSFADTILGSASPMHVCRFEVTRVTTASLAGEISLSIWRTSCRCERLRRLSRARQCALEEAVPSRRPDDGRGTRFKDQRSAAGSGCVGTVFVSSRAVNEPELRTIRRVPAETHST